MNALWHILISLSLYFCVVNGAYVVLGLTPNNIDKCNAEALHWGGQDGFLYIGQTFTNVITLQMYSYYIRPYAGNQIRRDEVVRGAVLEFNEGSFYPTRVIWSGTSTLGTQKGNSPASIRSSYVTFYKVTMNLGRAITLSPDKTYMFAMYIRSVYANDQYAVAAVSGHRGLGYAYTTTFPPPTNSLYWETEPGSAVTEIVAGNCDEAPCKNGGECVGQNLCSCINGWKGTDCTSYTCSPSCKNGGSCYAPNACSCVNGWTGSTCTSFSCTTSCKNGGICIGPDTCSCTSQWSGATCTTPRCTNECQNGGNCTSPNKCTCAAGWTGAVCTTPVCTQQCVHGNCEGVDFCHCFPNWYGYDCNTSGCNAMTTCGGHGTCAVNGSCICNTGFDEATNCASCKAGYFYYPNCYAASLLPPVITDITPTSVSFANISVMWRLPANSSAAVDAFNLEWVVDGMWQLVYNGKNSSAIFTNLTPNTSYAFRLQALNGYGKGAYSYFNISTSYAGAPSHPLPPTYDRYSRAYVALEWSPPVKNGGLPIQGYTIRMHLPSTLSNKTSQRVPSDEWVEWAVPTPQFKADGLSPNTTYQFAVAAYNELGTGPFSNHTVFVSPEIMCGDGECDDNENCGTCFLDCGACGYKECAVTASGECNGMGVCMKGLCNCRESWFGEACQFREEIPVMVAAQQSEPRIGISVNATSYSGVNNTNITTSVSFGVNFTEIRELTVNGDTLHVESLQNSELTSNISDLSTTFIYRLTLSNKARVRIEISIFHAPTVFDFANETIQMPANGVKYTVRIEDWHFLSIKNRLVLSMRANTQQNPLPPVSPVFPTPPRSVAHPSSSDPLSTGSPSSDPPSSDPPSSDPPSSDPPSSDPPSSDPSQPNPTQPTPQASDQKCTGPVGPQQNKNTSYDSGSENLRSLSVHFNGATLYGKFLESAYFDGEVRKVQFIYNQTSDHVEIIMPHFWDYVEFDPNFQVLVDPASAPVNNTECDDTIVKPQKRSKNVKPVIIGCVFAALVVIAAVVIAVYLVKVKNVDKKFSKAMHEVSLKMSKL